MGAYPNYEFSTAKNNKDWSLNINCSSGIINWDTFFYHSNGQYPPIASITRVRDWAYYHE